MLLPVMWGMFKYVYINIQHVLMAFQVSEDSGFSLNNWKLIIMELQDKDSTIWLALRNTISFWIVGMIKIPLAFSIAYFMFKKIWGHRIFSLIFFLPAMVAGVIMVTAFKDIIKVGGPLYTLLYDWFGYELPNLITNYDTALPTILVYSLWSGFGINIMMFIGAMKRIGSDVLDAAHVDGCGEFREFFLIVLPLCWKTLSTMLILCAIGIFNASGPILVFTNGNYGTTTLSFWMFDQVRDGSLYYPATVGLFFTIISLPLILTVRYLLNRGDKEVEY